MDTFAIVQHTGRRQDVLYAGRTPLPVRQPEVRHHVHLVDLPRLQAERHLQRDGKQRHLLQAEKPGVVRRPGRRAAGLQWNLPWPTIRRYSQYAVA